MLALRAKLFLVVIILAIAGVFLYLFGGLPWLRGSPNSNSDSLTVLDGFKVSVFANDLKGPRVIAFDPAGRMVVSETEAGRISILEDSDSDGKADVKRVLMSNLRLPHGVDFYKDKNEVDYIYIAETHQVARYEYSVNRGEIVNQKGENIAFLPAEGRYFTRTIAFGPNLREVPLLAGQGANTVSEFEGFLSKEKLYISVGSSCDACLENTWKRAAILESDPEGTYTAEFAGGLHNTAFFTFHPQTGQIWAAETGRDGLGGDLPPDEINIIKSDKKYGWPFCYGRQVRDATFSPEKIERTDLPTDCSLTEAPKIEIPAHSVPLGLAFVISDKWPADWQNNLLVALHGSENQNEPVGYKIVRYSFDQSGSVANQEDFLAGFDDGRKIRGRPVDLKFDSGGNLFVSDDEAGIIYKISPIEVDR